MPNYKSGTSPWYTQRNKIKKVVIENGVTNIGEYAFSACSSLATINISNSVTTIAKSAFYQCSGLVSVIIPNSVTSIGEYSFYQCKELTSVIIPNSVIAIGESAFSGCKGLVSVIIPNSVTSIGSGAFYNCNLKSITIGADVTFIGSNIFGYNSKPTKTIWLPNTPPSGYENASGGINYVSNDNYSQISKNSQKVYKHLSSMFEVDGIKYVPVSPSERTCDAIDCIYDETTEDVKINDVVSYKNIEMKVLNINPSTFSENEFIKTLYINNGGMIGNNAFRGCKNITNVTFGNKITGIGSEAFYGCVAIKNLEIPDCITSVGSFGFCGCKALQSVTIGNGSTTLHDYCFEYCISLQNVTIGNGSSSIGKYCFKNCDALQNVIVGNGLKSVGDYSFSGCKSLQKIIFEDCPATIGSYAFENCSSLSELNLGKEVKSIGDYAFRCCSSLSKISIPETTISIGDYAFAGCKSLTNLTIEDRTESISLGSEGYYPLFSDCPINSVYLGGKLSYNTSADFGYSPFYQNKDLQSVIIADTEDQIYDNEFYGCTNLKSVKIGDGVKSIGNRAFSGCANLESFSFGKSMQSIGKEAFSDCTKMTSITSCAAKAPECGSQALDDIDKWSCVLSVPYSCLASYQNADQWKEFFFIQEAEVDEKLVANKAAFDKYKSEQKTIIEALAKEDDSDAVKAIINKAISDINAMEYDVKISLDENKAKILSFINLIDDAVEKQRAEDQKTNGINELQITNDELPVYDLNGRKITNSVFKSGLYIRNGKKYAK